MNSILICDDEKDILDMLSMFFRSRGYRIMTAGSGQEVFEQIEKQPDIILLDINMPGPDGIDVCRRIRNIVSCPIIFLTARVDEADKINGFAAGGDDYVVKPFSPAELEARVFAHIRRESRARTGSKIRFSDDLIIDYSERSIAAGDNVIKLPRKEFDIVALLTDKKVQQIINDFPVRNFSEGLDAKYTYNNSIQSFWELSQVKVFGGLTVTKQLLNPAHYMVFGAIYICALYIKRPGI